MDPLDGSVGGIERDEFGRGLSHDQAAYFIRFIFICICICVAVEIIRIVMILVKIKVTIIIIPMTLTMMGTSIDAGGYRTLVHDILYGDGQEVQSIGIRIGIRIF